MVFGSSRSRYKKIFGEDLFWLSVSFLSEDLNKTVPK